ncbi:MAG: TIR domain-containing protein [Methanotrichaceae archaeon]
MRRDETRPKVFIGYAREDGETTKRLDSELTAAGADVWFDKKSILPGQRWEVAIKKAIKNSRYFLALLSSNSVNKKGYVQKELAQAFEILDEFPESEIYIIPVRIDECEPSHEKLCEIQWADMFPNWEDGLEKILASMNVQIQESLKVPVADVDVTTEYRTKLSPVKILPKEDAVTWYNKGVDLGKLGRYEEANAAFDKAKKQGIE